MALHSDSKQVSWSSSIMWIIYDDRRIIIQTSGELGTATQWTDTNVRIKRQEIGLILELVSYWNDIFFYVDYFRIYLKDLHRRDVSNCWHSFPSHRV